MCKKPKHPVFDTPQVADLGPPERTQHGGVRYEKANIDEKTGQIMQMRAKARISCKLDWYWDKGTIDAQMYHAGIRFAVLFFDSGKVPRVNVMWRERIQKSMSSSDYDNWLNSYSHAQNELLKAYDVLDPAERDVLREVAGLDNYAGGAERTRKLRTGLRALATHWRIAHDVRVSL